MAADELGRRVDDDVGAPLDGTAQRGRRRGVVDHQAAARARARSRPAARCRRMSSLGLPSVSVYTRLGAAVDGRAQAVEVVGIDEPHRDAQLRQRVVEQVVGAAVERSGGDDLVARRGQRDDGERLRRLARGQRQPRDAAFERGNALLEDVGGRVHDAGVDVAELLQREQPGGMVGIVEDVGGGLVDGDGARLGGGIGRLAAMHGQGGEMSLRSCRCLLIAVLSLEFSAPKENDPRSGWTVGR